MTILKGPFGGIAAGVGVFLFLAPAAASPWGRPAGEVMSITRLDTYRAEEAERHFTQKTLQTYTELGLPGRWMAGGKIAQGWQDVERPDYADTRSGVVDAEVFIQRQIDMPEGQTAALQLTYAPATSLDSVVRGAEADGRDQAVQVSGLYGWGSNTHFIATAIGYRASLGEDADQLRADITLGRKWQNGIHLLLDTYGRVSMGGNEATGLDYDLLTLSPSVVLPVTGKVSLQLGASADVAARNLDRGEGAFVSLWVGP